MLTISAINSNNPIGHYKNKKYIKSKNIINKNNNVPFKSAPIKILEKEYLSLTTQKGLKPVEAFFSISSIQTNLDNLLTSILQNEKLGVNFVSDITKNPRKSAEVLEILQKKVGPNSINLLTFMYNSPYNKAYEAFITQKFNNAKSVEELLTIRPDWRGEKLLQKNVNLNNESFELGKVPQDIPKSDLINIINYLRTFMQNSGAKHRINIDELNLCDKKYNFEYFVDGKTDKNVFGLFLPNGNKYIIKIADKNLRSLDNTFALGTLAKIDTYLTANKARNSAPFIYYNHNDNFLIYDYVEHIPVSEDTRNLSNIIKHIPDYKNLSLQFNDNVGSNNCFLMSQNSNKKLENFFEYSTGVSNGEWISVDNDHVTFTNKLHPHVGNNFHYLPNGMQFCV